MLDPILVPTWLHFPSQNTPKLHPKWILKGIDSLIEFYDDFLSISDRFWLPSWAILGRLGGILGSLGTLLGVSWGVLGAGSSFSAVLGRTWGVLGASLGPLGGVLGASWGHLGPSWALLGASWGVLEASWGLLAAKTHQKRGGPEFWGPLGAVLGSILGGFWDIFLMDFQYFSYLTLQDITLS